jgi:simple sugar transport system permease protein
MVGLAGAFLSTSYLLSFVRGMSADRGWMAVAAVIFGDGHLGWTVFAVIIFGVAQAGGFQLQAMGVPSHLALMLPYVLVIIALVTRGIGKSRSS